MYANDVTHIHIIQDCKFIVCEYVLITNTSISHNQLALFTNCTGIWQNIYGK